MYISRLAKAAIFGLCYYLILNVYLYYALAFKDVHTGILANKIISTLCMASDSLSPCHLFIFPGNTK